MNKVMLELLIFVAKVIVATLILMFLSEIIDKDVFNRFVIALAAIALAWRII